nr:MAG TPA: hypothetical protein [Caudoviricetes sp.]
MALTGWVGRVSRLPSLFLSTTALTTLVLADDRLLAVVGPGQHLIADALAEPGVPVTYRAGQETVTLVRPEGDWWGVHVCDASGRSVPWLAYESNDDPVSWASTVKMFNARVARWAIEDDPVTGEGQIALDDPAREADVWATLRSHSPILLVPAAQTPGVPPRCVIVNTVKRTRVTDGLILFKVAWTQALPETTGRGLSAAMGAVPVTTWGEWQAYADAHGEGGWQNYSAHKVAQLVQGMPV